MGSYLVVLGFGLCLALWIFPQSVFSWCHCQVLLGQEFPELFLSPDLPSVTPLTGHPLLALQLQGAEYGSGSGSASLSHLGGPGDVLPSIPLHPQCKTRLEEHSCPSAPLAPCTDQDQDALGGVSACPDLTPHRSWHLHNWPVFAHRRGRLRCAPVSAGD